MNCVLKVLSLALLAGAGCMSPETASEAARLHVFMSRWDDVQKQKAVPRMSFAKNDMPTAVVQNLGWKDQQVIVEMIRQDTGKVASQSVFTIGRNETKHVTPREGLPAGSYILKATAENANPVTQNFSVYGY